MVRTRISNLLPLEIFSKIQLRQDTTTSTSEMKHCQNIAIMELKSASMLCPHHFISLFIKNKSHYFKGIRFQVRVQENMHGSSLFNSFNIHFFFKHNFCISHQALNATFSSLQSFIILNSILCLTTTLLSTLI